MAYFSSCEPILRVALPQILGRDYDIIADQGILDFSGKLIKERLGLKNCLIVTDQNVMPLYLERVEKSLGAAGHHVLESIVLPAGEASKSWACLQDLLEKIAAQGSDRKTLLIALGGGVIGDLTGFAASIYMRGVDFIQIPTTLLAQVDSSVGGKTGIDTDFGKNTVGTFHQPRLVIADVDTLSTLPARQLLAGYAEVIKYGLVIDETFFDWCCSNSADLIEGSKDKRLVAIRQSCAFKVNIVLEDEREAGRRALLNLGHTFGHALESLTGFSDTLLHGQAVAIGSLMAFQLSAEMGLIPPADVARVERHFKAIGLPTQAPKMDFDIDKLMALMGHDKKAENGQLTLILVRGIGKGFVAKNVDTALVRQLWEKMVK